MAGVEGADRGEGDEEGTNGEGARARIEEEKGDEERANGRR
ncbi:hypothetical protein [Serinicoccus chungangensis]|nr:hypothetical protein [Serinicoccus chungangensis]